jgi:hypothetical protein
MRRQMTIGILVMIGLFATTAWIPAEAQARRRTGPTVRAPQGGRGYPGYRVQPRVHVYHGASWGPSFYNPWWGFGPGWGWYYPPSPYYPYFGRPAASVRVEVSPKTAEVYVDGHFAGMVDDFDGFFQRLDLAPGGYEITVYQEGFRTYSERLYLRAGHTFRMKHVLEPLAPGEPNEPRPMPAVQPQGQPGPQIAPGMPDPRATPPVDRPEGQFEPPPQPDPTVRMASGFGQVAIRVQPSDAEILIDDEPWRGPQGAERLVVNLPAGTHRVEIRRAGFDPFVTSIDVKKGETAVLNVSLGKI